MGNSVVVWIGIAVLLFWSMGAYNRLMRLRSQGILAFAALEVLLSQLVVTAKASVPETAVVADVPSDLLERDASAAFSAACCGLVAAAEQFNVSLKVAHTRPLNGPTTSALKTAFETLCLSWSRLRALPADPAGTALPVTLQLQWEQIAEQVEVARTEFNRRVENYNEAISQFPALLLAWVFGFKPAQPI
jgi:LemA protein